MNLTMSLKTFLIVLVQRWGVPDLWMRIAADADAASISI